MAVITVTGIKSTKVRNLVKSTANWLTYELLGDNRPDLTLDIQFVDLHDDDFLGDCTPDDDADLIRPKEFIIRIDNYISLKRVLKTLTHEMIHVKQYTKNELYDYLRDHNKSRWHRKIVNTNKVKYINHPWEIEARSLESVLYKKYKTENNIKFKDYCYKHKEVQLPSKH